MIYSVEVSTEATDQVFSYWMNGTKLLHFNASMFGRVRKQAPEAFTSISIPLNEEIYDLCMQYRGIEEPKVNRLHGKHLREPGLVCLWLGDKAAQGIPDYTVVDGHHRIVRRYRGGVRSMDFWACWPGVWGHCLIDSSPEEDVLIAATLPPRPKEKRAIIHRVIERT